MSRISGVQESGVTVASIVQRIVLMEQGLTFVLVAGALAASLLACSSSDSSNSQFGGPQQDPNANQAPISPIVPDQSSSTTPPSTAAKCDPAIPASFKPTWTPPVTAKACSTADISGYYTACLADPSKKDACATWTAAHADCTTCLEPKSNAGPFQWQDTTTAPRLYYTLNVAGCIAFEQNKLAETDCGGAYNAAVECTRDSCTQCLDTGGSFQQFTTCEQAVQQQGVCKSYQAAIATPCQGYKNTGSPVLQCFKGYVANEGDAEFFQRFAAIFCGQ